MAAKPNFFIVGAPKCGTTALYEYLRGHPNVFMPHAKEPVLRQGVRQLKQVVGGERMGRLKSGLVRLNTVTEGRAPLAPALHAEMVETFRDEVRLLSRLLDRDLTHWGPGRA